MLSSRDLLLLDRAPLLAGLAGPARRAVTTGGVVRRFAAGEVLWVAGAEPRGLFVVLEGRVRVVRAPAGRQHTVHEEGPGGTLGEVPLFDGGRYPATAVAAERTACLVLDRATLGAALAADPELAFRLLARLAGRVRTLVARLDGRTAGSVEQRLAALLLDRHARARADGAATFTLARTQAEAAEDLGTAREVLVRALRRLRERGVVATSGRGRYRVADEDALRRIAADRAS